MRVSSTAKALGTDVGWGEPAVDEQLCGVFDEPSGTTHVHAGRSYGASMGGSRQVLDAEPAWFPCVIRQPGAGIEACDGDIRVRLRQLVQFAGVDNVVGSSRGVDQAERRVRVRVRALAQHRHEWDHS